MIMDATQAALISPGLRATIRQMSRRDNLTVEEIAEALGSVPPEVIRLALEQDQTQAQSQIDGATGVESSLAPLRDKAIGALEAVLDYGESEFARLRAIELVLRGASGGLRPRVQVNQTFNADSMNVLIQQAVAAHARQIESAK
jgi:hypothetical protein